MRPAVGVGGINPATHDTRERRAREGSDLVLARELPIRVETFTLVRRGARCTAFAAIAGPVLDRPLEQRLGPRALRAVALADAGTSALEGRAGIWAGRGPESVNAFGSLASAAERMREPF